MNVEIKARVDDAASMRRRIEALGVAPPRISVQEDIFFAVPRGRLKLRLLDDGTGELIHYRRENSPGPRPSRYVVSRTLEPGPLRAALEGALGSAGTVRKRREIFLHGRTRIHLDDVEGLGPFLELEVVLGPDETPEHGREVALGLMRALGLSPEALVGDAYVDLLAAPARRAD
jgi:adenylate cyclase class IV